MQLNTIEILFIMMCCGLFAYFIGYVLGTLSHLKIKISELEDYNSFTWGSEHRNDMYFDIVKTESELKEDGVQWYYFNSDGVCIAEEFKKKEPGIRLTHFSNDGCRHYK